MIAALLAMVLATNPVACTNGKARSVAIDKELADLAKMLESIIRRQQSISYMFDSRPRNIDRWIQQLLGDELPQRDRIPKVPPLKR
jgi:phosphopantothenate synthetase